MKFVSKASNYCITLKPGIPGSILTGALFNPGLHLRFENGFVTINDPEIIEMAKRSKYFNIDFKEYDENEGDVYSKSRKDFEPAHMITEMQNGFPSKTMSTPVKTKLTSETTLMLQEMAKTMAIEMTKELAPKLAADMLKEMLEKKQEQEEEKSKVEEENKKDSDSIKTSDQKNVKK
jgi:hypothetical protein